MKAIKVSRASALRFACPVLVAAAVGPVLWANAGQLDPPAGPINPTGPTTFNQQDIGAGPLFSINASGSYILTSDIVAPGGYTGDGIAILADNVTLNMNGFALIGVVGSQRGIRVTLPERWNISIYNGTVRDWGGDGVDAGLAKNSQLRNLRVYQNGGNGIVLGEGGTITGCTATNNVDAGIFVSTASANGGCTITGCTASGNSCGITALRGSTVINCTAESNTQNGITVSFGGTVANCTARNNGSTGIIATAGSMVSGCTARENGEGILAGGASTVRGCTAAENTGDGIHVTFDSLVVGNLCDSNGAAGIHATSTDNRIEGNNVGDNARGIDVDSAGNLIIKNSAAANTINYSIVANNKVGVIVFAPNSGAISGSTGGAGVGTTRPWDNFSF